MLRVLYVGATSVCLERVNNEAYYAPQSFSVILDGQDAMTDDLTKTFYHFISIMSIIV